MVIRVGAAYDDHHHHLRPQGISTMSNERDPSTDQPLPTKNSKSQPVAMSIKALIDARTALGIKKYGTPLMSHNGRDAKMDALEEAVDLIQYLMQINMEQSYVISDLSNQIGYLLDEQARRSGE